MIRITSETLEEAYKEASIELDCSIVELDIEVLQYPSKGFLGLFAKPAIISAKNKNTPPATNNFFQESKKSSFKKETPPPSNNMQEEIEEGMKALIESSCFNAYLKEVKIDHPQKSVYIALDGEDAALLIGQEGYRYKALSYMIHNWIKIKYHYFSTLEIAEFLKMQEAMIENYIKTLEEKIENSPRVQTKPLDGVLVKLALEKLRAKYPNKHVAIRTLKNGKKTIIVNKHRRISH